MRWLRSPASALPEIEPLVPVMRAQPFDDPSFQFEPKYQGCRALLYLRGSAAWFQSRSGRTMPELDPLAASVRETLTVEIAILDGEVIGLDGEGRQARASRPDGGSERHYAAFDVLWRDRTDLRPRPLWSRRLALEQLIPKASGVVSRVYAVPEQGRALFRAAQRLHYPGIVAKRRTDPYREGSVWYVIPARLAGWARSSRGSGSLRAR